MNLNNLIKIVFILPYRAGGVASIIRNILEYIDQSDLYIHVILIKNIKDPQAYNPDDFNADKTTVFEYSSLENKYSVFKRFGKLIPEKPILITNDYFELQALNSLKQNNKIIHIIHGSEAYEYEQIYKFRGIIDAVVGVSNYICENAKKILSDVNIPVTQILHPIPESVSIRKLNPKNPLKIIFVGRFKKAKGIFDLSVIDELLTQAGIQVLWTIVGFGPEEEKFKQQWGENDRVNWTGKLTNQEILSLYPKHDIFILPSHSEGFPVVLIEAMKASLVPLVTNLPGGIPEIINDGKNGFVFLVNSPKKYADVLEMLNNNRLMIDKISKNAVNSTKEMFDPVTQSQKYKDEIYNQLNSKDKEKTYYKENLGFLDKPFLPNFAVKLIRNFKIA